MANVSEQSAVVARAGKAFTFTRTRANAADAEFFPGAGARLRFASNDTDTLTLPGLPVGLLVTNDVVTVAYKNTTVFKGTVSTRVERQGRGTDRVEDVTVEGPWGLMARLVFRQEWKIAGQNGTVVGASCSHLVLNQDALGDLQDMTEQVQEIASYAASKCGFSYSASNIDAGEQQLPPDEARNLTCAAAIMRTLRFFPQTVCRFDYSTATPTFHVSMPPASPSAASYLASIPMTQRSYTRTSHPVVGVDIATEGFDLVTGNNVADATLRKFTHDTAGVTDSVDTLHIFMPLEKGSASSSWESLDVEVFDNNRDIHSISFWAAEHPALAGYTVLPAGQSYSGGNKVQLDGNITPAVADMPYANLTDTTVGDLERFGLGAQVVRFTCPVKIFTPDKEEKQVLTLDYVCTNATTRTYTRQTGSSSTAGETLPAGLAAAILAQRGGELMGEEVTIRLGASFPTLGDADVVGTGASAQVLYLQSFEVDCYDLTAQLHFGRPAFLSPEDMRDLLLGFRQRGFASNVPNRSEPDADDNMDDAGGVQPLKSSSMVVSSIKKVTIQGDAQSGNSIILDTGSAGTQVSIRDSANKLIALNAHALAANETVQVHSLKYTDANGQQQTVKVLMSDEATIPAGGDAPSGTSLDVVTGISFAFDQESSQLKATLTKKSVKVLEVASNDPASGTADLPLWKQDFVVGSKYDESSHEFTNLAAGSVKTTGDSIDMDGHEGDGVVFEAESHQAEVS